MPYNQNLFSGIADAGDSIAAGIMRMKEGHRRDLDNAKAADVLFKVNPELLQSLGMSTEQYQAQSARDRFRLAAGVMQAAGYKRGQADAQRKQDLATAQIGSYNASANASESNQTRAKDLARGLDTFKQARAIWGDRADSRKLRELSLDTGAFDDPGVRDLIGGLQQQEQFDAAANRRATPGTVSPLEGLTDQAFVTTSPGGAGVVVPKVRRVEKQAAPNYPWLFTEDIDQFKRELSKVQDPNERDLLLQTRLHINQLTGKPDPLAQALVEILQSRSGASPGARPAAPTGAAPASGSVRVKSPAGKVGTIPAAQVKDAIAAGYQVLQ
jgi:hypothetical protein